jgi:hypothetical protein
VARLNAVDYARTIQNICHGSEFVVSYDVQILDDVVVKIRVDLSIEAFIAIFYNADSGKCSYALIKRGRRIFGADNALIGWHLHPFDDPEKHLRCEELSFADFLHAVEDECFRNELR